MIDCDCYSYNWQTGTVENALLTAPNGKTVCIDACIAGAVQALWDGGVGTLGSCCGHGIVPPSIILDEHEIVDIDKAQEILDKAGAREFQLLQWQWQLNTVGRSFQEWPTTTPPELLHTGGVERARAIAQWVRERSSKTSV